MRILIADDHDLVRECIGAVLSRDGFENVEFADCLSCALRQVQKSEPYDLIMLDYDMPGMDGLAGLKQLISEAKSAPVALLSGIASTDIVNKALKEGAAGYIPKTLSSRSLVSAAKFMASGEIYVPIDMLNERTDKSNDLLLSDREMEVLNGICAGDSNKEIARCLGLREVTIKLHVKTLSRKLNARNRTHAAMIARDLSLI